MEKGTVSNSILVGSQFSPVESLKQRFEAALKGLREEFDDHRESINDNTNEIEANHEMLCRLESKVDRLEAQIEQLQLAVASAFGASAKVSVPQGVELGQREKDVFLVMYTAPNDKPLTYREIASAMKESEFLVRGYVTNMVEKGVPIAKRYVNDVAYLSLDSQFKERQARENIVKLSQRTVVEFAVA